FWNAASEQKDQPLTILMPERFREPHRQGITRIDTTGESRVLGRRVELVGRRKDGSEFPLELSMSRWETRQGPQFAGTMRDLSRRREAEKTLLESEERYRAVVENLAEAIVIKRGTTHVFVNNAFLTIHGLSDASTVIGRSLEEFVI